MEECLMPLTGKQILLREIRREDYPFFVKMRNDLETQAWNSILPPDYTLEMISKRFNNREFSFDRNSATFVIEEIETGNFVGSIGYNNLTKRFDCELGIRILKEYWSSGYSIEAQELILRFLFHELGLRVVRLWTHSLNIRAIKSAEKFGFKIALRQREGLYRNGQLADNIGMDLLREEYYANHPELKDNLPTLL